MSRVGGAAQVKAMRQVAGTLRLDLAQYRELAGFAQFGSDLDQSTRAQLDRGERLVEVLKQRQYEPLPIEKQMVMLYAGTRGRLDRYAVADIGAYQLLTFLETRHPALLPTLAARKAIDDRFASTLDQALDELDALGGTPPFAAAA